MSDGAAAHVDDLVLGVLDGPNLNRVGRREPGHYGDESLEEIRARLGERAEGLGVELRFFQSNHEGELVDWIQEEEARVDGWLVNAGGLTHTSVALRDALTASGRPFAEVHLSNVHAREPFRRESLLADAAVGVVAGFEGESYLMALQGLAAHLRRDREA